MAFASLLARAERELSEVGALQSVAHPLNEPLSPTPLGQGMLLTVSRRIVSHCSTTSDILSLVGLYTDFFRLATVQCGEVNEKGLEGKTESQNEDHEEEVTHHHPIVREAIDLWSNRCCSPSALLDSPGFRTVELDTVVQHLKSLSTCLLHLFISYSSLPSQLQRCVLCGCSTFIAVGKHVVNSRLATMHRLQVYLPPVETMSFILRMEAISMPLQEWSLTHSCCRKLASSLRRVKRSFVQTYGRFLFDHLLQVPLHRHMKACVAPSATGTPLNVCSVVWSVWQLCCSFLRPGGNRPVRDAVSRRLLLSGVLTHFSVHTAAAAALHSADVKKAMSKDLCVFIFFVRLLRERLGESSSLYKALYKLAVAYSIDGAAASESTTPRTPRSEEEENNTARFLSVVWMVPPLTSMDLTRVVQESLTPWSPLFPHADYLEAAVASDIQFSRHICRFLRSH